MYDEHLVHLIKYDSFFIQYLLHLNGANIDCTINTYIIYFLCQSSFNISFYEDKYYWKCTYFPNSERKLSNNLRTDNKSNINYYGTSDTKLTEKTS